ncbi:MAG: PAS domain S-box protein, partial [Deltaproteobacteria bacterium]|nr:PAS domain S-box protein [Deltaproteobacteria bacterium]
MERNEMKYLMLILLVVCVFAARTTPSSAQNNQVKNVLVLNSYHKGFAWSDGIMEGIWSEFKRSGQNIKLDIEYMDTKRISDQKHYQNLYELYKHKFSKRDYDLILTSDDNAFSFILKYHDELFLEKPVVFCGLNSLDKSLEADLLRLGWITGSVEMYDIRGNLDLILNLHPDVKQIVVISDNTVSSKKCKAKVQEAAHQMPDSIRFNYLEEDAYMEDILAQVRGLPLDSVVFLMSFFKDREGKYYTPQAGGKMISKNSPVPVYSAWDFYLGHGITGGLTTSSNAQGEMGAKIALRVLNGEKISDIPVSREPANYYMFDYKEMERFGIKLSNLPKDSIVINKPYSFYTEYKGLILTALGAFVCLILIILVLIRNIFRRRQSEKLFRKLFERSPVGLFIVQDGKFQLLNSQFLRLTGYNEEDFLGKEPLTFILPEDRNMVNENTIKMLKEGLSFPFEFRVINKNGETRWVELTITSIQYQQKRAILGYCIDITERKQAQQEIIKRQKYLESVVYSAPDAIMTLDASRNIIEWNPGAKRIFGYTRDEVVGKDIDDLISRPDVKHELKGFTKRLLSREIVLPFKAVRYRKDGTPVNVIVAGSPILIDGKLHGVVAVYTDITEEKKLEAQLHQAQKIEAIGTLAGGIAHDFNNILAAIIGYAELVKMKLP